ncbi:adhesion G protein-coupled receptor E3-like isoform X2 [Brachyhypopomus gauderio]|uniref:adhesion G protein-coupled receptor E3-like isoform X2 n=1 Tax=Brachyhypopomus gauderio TaxID=698409 RepID=UPI0040436957
MRSLLIWLATLLTIIANCYSANYRPTPVYYNFTVNGNSGGAPCFFPFFYSRQFYSDCVNISHNTPWCSTTNNYSRDGKWGECVSYEVCSSHQNLSDPWRNVGFCSSSFSYWPINDSNLQAGWYSFTGIGGDRLVYSCPYISLIWDSNILFNNNGSSQSSSTFHLYTCDGLENSTQVLDCGGGLLLYYLSPFYGIYTTRHSSCSPSSCGEHAQCNHADGSCVCDAGLSTPDGFLPIGDSYEYLIESKECKNQITYACAKDFLEIIQNITDKLPQKTVETVLKRLLNFTELLENTTSGQNDLIAYGNAIMKAIEKLVSTLVRETDTYYDMNITVQALEVQIFVVGPNASLTEIPRLNTSNAYMDIDLIGISKNNNGSAAVAFISYSNMSNFLKPSFFNTANTTLKTMMSTVVLATLPKTKIKQLTEPVNFTLKHTAELEPEGFLSCAYWNETEWVVDGCIIIQTNISETICSCTHLSTFALIMQTNPNEEASDMNDLLELLNTVFITVGLVFLTLDILTFALCHRSQPVTSVALINLCTSLLLAHMTFLLTHHFQNSIKSYQLGCALLAGVLQFLFLSAFVWMFIDAVLLFIAVKNLSKIRPKQKEAFSWKWLIIIGYVISLVIVGVSAGLFPDGYGSEQCWLKKDENFLWSFLGPVCFVLASNGILYIIIVIIIMYTLKQRDPMILQMNQRRTHDKLIKSVILKSMAQFVILGCPWILGFFTNSNVVEILFLVLNSQQGTFIFLVHCIFNQEVRQNYRKWLKLFCCCCKPATDDQKGSSHADTN